MNFERSSGILLHITSLPGSYGIGTMGKEAYNFIDFLVISRQKFWQILPLGHTGYGDSPYQCYSAFAGNPLLINLDKLVEEGLLDKKDLPDNISFSEEQVEFGKVIDFKYPLLQVAYKNHSVISNKLRKTRFDSFCKKNKKWLDDYAFFMALKSHFNNVAWSHWSEDIKLRRPDAVRNYKEMLAEEIEFYKFVQYLFYKQWLELKSYANVNDIKIIGDIPLYVAFDSSDAWANTEIFEFDDKLNPKRVAGVPPDYFSETGQLWGNPLYNWEYQKATGFEWWIDRLRANFKLYDVVRIDHFRGLSAYWAVNFGEQTAIRGQWVDAPGDGLLNAIKNSLGDLAIIAEDLGVITDDVIELREKYNLPGMKILQFAFDSAEENDFIPHSYNKNCIVYTGTHDNDTTTGHYLTSSEKDKLFMNEYFQVDKNEPAWSFIKLAWSTVADVAIAPLQDVLRLGSNARMNFPGKASGYWGWRYSKAMLTDKHADELARITRIYGR